MSRLDLGRHGTPLWLPAADTVVAGHEKCMGGGMAVPKVMLIAKEGSQPSALSHCIEIPSQCLLFSFVSQRAMFMQPSIVQSRDKPT